MVKMKNEKKFIGFNIEKELWKKIRIEAIKADMKLSEYLEKIIRESTQ